MIEIISNDKIHIQFTDIEAVYSITLKELFYNEDEDKNGEKKISETIPLDYISGEYLQILKLLLGYLVEFNLNNLTMKTINNYTDLTVPIKNILEINEEFTIEKMFKFIDICNFLNIPVLLYIFKMKMSEMIEGKTENEIKKIFNIDMDLNSLNEGIEEFVKNNEICEIMEKNKLEKKDFTKKENEAIDIMKNFLAN